jgi:hypothetical protein
MPYIYSLALWDHSDRRLQFAKDAEARKLSLGAKQDIAFSAHSFFFTADVVTKLDKF